MYSTYISKLTLVSPGEEFGFLLSQKRTCYNSVYPYQIFPEKELREITFAPITILYGGNGSGKSTLLNVLAEKAGVTRHSPFSGSAFFRQYVEGCRLEGRNVPEGSQILTSDDVFDYLLNIRCLNDGIDARREALFADYLDRKYAGHQLRSLSEYDDWKQSYDAKRKSQSRYVKDRLMRNVDMFSNGQSAMKYFVDRITEDALYLLDEPENSLSIALQQDLCDYLQGAARFYGCQFVIATHSPVLLAMKDAMIYDLDTAPVRTRKWTELDNVRRYFEFFEQHRAEFL